MKKIYVEPALKASYFNRIMLAEESVIVDTNTNIVENQLGVEAGNVYETNANDIQWHLSV